MGKLRGQRSRPPDDAASLSLAAHLQSCGRAGDLRRARALHARLLLSGAAAASTFLVNHLITTYSRCADAGSAVSVFRATPRPNLVSWTVLVSCLARNAMYRDALDAFAAMHRAAVAPTEFALSSAAAPLAASRPGAQLHCVTVALGFDAELFVASNLADMYSKCGLLGSCILRVCVEAGAAAPASSASASRQAPPSSGAGGCCGWSSAAARRTGRIWSSAAARRIGRIWPVKIFL